ncbi:hypothetical protein PanWU01x14_245950 [Parasponia andersonii]|uniref:Uncharacterized protein n=1 Tax=Parasponia andersonii TaxID=3476 RepID=A0A2P5BEK2_PARAD|nr:hypothetical protein PanWU01x14_245950 [Parasponia andersonii]
MRLTSSFGKSVRFLQSQSLRQSRRRYVLPSLNSAPSSTGDEAFRSDR